MSCSCYLNIVNNGWEETTLSTNQLKKPHVVIIMADQLRYDALSKFTPNLNRLKEESVVFNRAYCASPLCVPARGSFFTGCYPNETGCLINGWEQQDAHLAKVKSELPNLYELLEADWDSWHTGKQHFITTDSIAQSASKTHWHPLEGNYNQYLKEHGIRQPGGPAFKGIVPEMASGTTTRAKTFSIPTTGCFEPGFDFFFDGYITRTSLDAIRNRDQSKPLLLNAMYLAPHPPLEIPEPWFSRWASDEIELPENVGIWSKSQSPLQLYNLTGALGTRYTKQQWKEIWRVYMGLVSLLDDCIGMLIGELKAQGIYDDTLILFTSDHGEMLGSHRLWQKMCMYEESVRTPLLMKFPKSFTPAINSSEVLVSSIDILPTLCDYLDVPVANGFSGKSLMPVIGGDKLQHREEVYIQFDGNGALGNFQRCMLEGDYKLIVDMFKDEVFLELYHIKEDPQEMDNLIFIEIHQTRALQMLDKLRIHMESTGDHLTIGKDNYKKFLEQYQSFHV
jgi:arylsulfatase A-like enzyme